MKLQVVSSSEGKKDLIDLYLYLYLQFIITITFIGSYCYFYCHCKLNHGIGGLGSYEGVVVVSSLLTVSSHGKLLGSIPKKDVFSWGEFCR